MYNIIPHGKIPKVYFQENGPNPLPANIPYRQNPLGLCLIGVDKIGVKETNNYITIIQSRCFYSTETSLDINFVLSQQQQ